MVLNESIKTVNHKHYDSNSKTVWGNELQVCPCEYYCWITLGCAHPTPLNKTGLLVPLPTMVGAFSRFSGSATIRVCWRHKVRHVNNNVAQYFLWPSWSHFFLQCAQIQVCVPLLGQTHRSCDGQWLPSSPHRPQCRTHCPAPSEGHLCNKGTMLKQNGDGRFLFIYLFLTTCQKPGVKKTTNQCQNWQQPGHFLHHRWRR